MNGFKKAFLGLILLVPMALSAQSPQQTQPPPDPCGDQSGGWKTICLRKQSQISDEQETQAYWQLQTKINALPDNQGGAAYRKQLSTLMRKNELDFVNASESYCNMEVVLATYETEIDKMMACQIRTAQDRLVEVNHIIQSLSDREAGK